MRSLGGYLACEDGDKRKFRDGIYRIGTYLGYMIYDVSSCRTTAHPLRYMVTRNYANVR